MGSPAVMDMMQMMESAHAQDLEGSRTMIARVRPDLSRPGGTPVAQARYFEMIVWRVRPGQEKTIEDARSSTSRRSLSKAIDPDGTLERAFDVSERAPKGGKAGKDEATADPAPASSDNRPAEAKDDKPAGPA